MWFFPWRGTRVLGFYDPLRIMILGGLSPGRRLRLRGHASVCLVPRVLCRSAILSDQCCGQSCLRAARSYRERELQTGWFCFSWDIDRRMRSMMKDEEALGGFCWN